MVKVKGVAGRIRIVLVTGTAAEEVSVGIERSLSNNGDCAGNGGDGLGDGGGGGDDDDNNDDDNNDDDYYIHSTQLNTRIISHCCTQNDVILTNAS